MIQANQLKIMASRALQFSDRKTEAGQRAILERKKDVLYLSASDGNSALRIFRDDIGDNFETVVNIYAFDEILNCFKSNDVIFVDYDSANSKRIILTCDKDKQIYILPVYPTLEVYNIPKPGKWNPISSHTNSVLQRARDWPVKHLRTASNLPLVFMFDKQIAGIVSGALSFFEEIDEDLEAQIPLTQLEKVSNVITHYFLTSGHIYFNGNNEWSMIPLDSRKVIAYKMLLDILNKQNIYSIKINISELLNITSKVRSMKKAEEILSPESNLGVMTNITPTSIIASTSLGSASGTVSSCDNFIAIDCKPNELFFHAIGHRAFLCDYDEVEIKIGPQMSFIAAQVGTGKVLGGLFRA